ncbi:TPA: DUF106 domain-containing protein [Candidatus Bathyarchaeota archaeon]|nr:DUF106 domain-containing protein [Candidatus Bathyarchaeota archaeon]
MAIDVSIMPWSTLTILAISVAIAFINTGVMRLLYTKLVGWNEYKTMQKEMSEYRSQQMAAARANDKKQLEKLKKKESQINNMTKKMSKPQMIQIGISFIYIVVWIFVLTPTFGRVPVAYLPGFSQLLHNDLGQITVVYWYPICSFLFGTLSSKLLGIQSIE